MLRRTTDPGWGPGGYLSSSARARISPSPVSCPTGLAPARQNFRPFHCGGLWLAVSITPATSRDPDEKYRRSVEASPRSTTSTPRVAMPSWMADASEGEDRRQSYPTSIRCHRPHPTEDGPTLVLRRDGPDDRLERHGLPVAIPPLGLAQVAGGERELTAADGHGDGDQVALLTHRAGPLRLVDHVRMVDECSPFDHSLLTPFPAPQTGLVTPSAADQLVAPT